MKNNTILILGLLLVAISVAGCSQPPEDLAKADIQTPTNEPPMAPATSGSWEPIDTTTSMFEFEGYAPGKSHVGTFTFYEGELLIQAGTVVGARGTIDARTVKSDGERLEDHLKSEDFFNAEVYPDITFSSSSLQEGVMTGDLTFNGVTNSISFPVVVDGTMITADFLLDTTPYNMKYVAVNKEVRIGFAMTT